MSLRQSCYGYLANNEGFVGFVSLVVLCIKQPIARNLMNKTTEAQNRYREYCVLVRARMKVTLVSIDILLSVNTSHLFATTIHVQYSKAYTSDSPSEDTEGLSSPRFQGEVLGFP